MNKKLLVLAVSSALTGTSALADTANVNVYGKLYPQYETESATGATSGAHPVFPTLNLSGTNLVSHQAVQSTNSNIGFKGDADVGGGMKGWFQVEQSIQLDTGTGTFSSRNSAAGLSGGFGNVFLGRWDTVYKQLGDAVSFLGVSSGNFVSVHSVLSNSSGVLGGASNSASFHLRRNNKLEYDTPSFGGFQLMADYSPDEGKTLNRNQWLRGIGAKWEAGPLYVALQNETHNDFFGISSNICGLGGTTLSTFAAAGACTATGGTTISAGAHSKDTANRLSFKYSLPSGTDIGFDVAQLEYKETPAPGATAGRVTKYKNKAYGTTVTQKLGALSLAASYVKADKGTCELSGGASCVTDGLGSTQMNIGAKYDFSKRVSVFGIATKLKNDPGAARSIESSVNPGADPEAAAVGVVVSF